MKNLTTNLEEAYKELDNVVLNAIRSDAPEKAIRKIEALQKRMTSMTVEKAEETSKQN
jgi:precorrin-6B methylase 2